MNQNKTREALKIRKATLEDRNEIESVMKRSMELLGQGYYTPEEVQSSMHYVCVPDEQIITDPDGVKFKVTRMEKNL